MVILQGIQFFTKFLAKSLDLLNLMLTACNYGFPNHQITVIPDLCNGYRRFQFQDGQEEHVSFLDRAEMLMLSICKVAINTTFCAIVLLTLSKDYV